MIRFILINMILITSCFGFTVNSVNVNCLDGGQCSDLEESFRSLRRTYFDTEHFERVLKIYIANEGVKELSYEVIQKKENNILNLLVSSKKRINEILSPKFVGEHSIELPAIFPVKRLDYFDVQKVRSSEKLITEIANERGFPDAKVDTKVSEKGRSGVNIRFVVDLGRPIKVKTINISTRSNFLKDFIKKKILYHQKSPFNIQVLKNEIEELRGLFRQYGYYLVNFDLKYRFRSRYSVELFLEVKNVDKFAFYFTGSNFLSDAELKNSASESLISSGRSLSVENYIQDMNEVYKRYAFLETKIKGKEIVKVGSDGEVTRYFEFLVNEGPRARVSDIVFKGNEFFSSNELNDLYYSQSSSQASAGFYDLLNYDNFTVFLRDKYISNGFVSVFIDKPSVHYNPKKKAVNVTFKIREGVRSRISSLTIKGVPFELETLLKSGLNNQKSEYFNPILFKQDLENIISSLQAKGYYYAKIINREERKLVKYKMDNTLVDINIELHLGAKLYADDIIILGNTFTRKILIKRELEFSTGDLVTSKNLQDSKNNLQRLGIFSSVQIKPVSIDRSKTDILIFVREKDFGTFELAPGVRSDIGFKLSSIISYSNIDGMNKRITFKGTVNKRFDLTTLDERRRKESSSLVEYDTSINYSEAHLFHSPFDFSTSISKIRRRFFTFDADIQRANVTLGFDYNRWLRVSSKYQIETISQFDATNDRDHGHFQIGSITPALNFDFRNRTINPRRGSFHELSYELANPALFSQEDKELTIDYYKLISRNKMYFPLSPDVTLAVLGTFGIQENRATDENTEDEISGYIPNIKVFRLSGIDLVRGFDNSEINRLSSGEDISTNPVTTRAYMVNLKVEPRLNINDSMVLGVFYDAGRLFVDEVELDKLRSSAGLSFKYVTPVGTLDFDYGIKLLRKRDSSGRLESPGRLHVSIGFF